MLFSDLSIFTMIHGIVLGGGSLMALSAALFWLYSMRGVAGSIAPDPGQGRALARLTGLIAVLQWLAVIVGTYVIFPPYRATPPEGTTDLSQYPRSLIEASEETAWLHAFAMECKEHVPWIAAMLATAAAFIALRYGARLLNDRQLRGMTTRLLAICFVLTACIALLGTFINKVAPTQ